MSRAGGARIVEIYVDAHWQTAPARRYLDPPTARQLRLEGITMVRVVPSLWSRVTGRSAGLVGRDISVARYLATTTHRGDDASPPA
ncbi:hypothetical protein JVX92_06595 [Microbacterium hominis]|uniref:Uncharacterized protein n=1 Tax=Microbacterium hominis TaxID=162426 RepID=A0A134DFM0_9MICO|nr:MULTISPECIES: hypothetical protein [Microbacterium]AUG30632.1 hypothetical protein CXR34_14930 [Microbacterium hominis]KXC05354.1 hypothetical protein MhomT_11560 [Microbacterium hominis]QOC26391.1 hypothetical protein IC745_02970 [Microbacterium hominis]QOC27575.1 hypothetical protein IC744_08630 [Microbacterium hominis]QRY41903.1 hypothetical protein JVX92_06595 [Microbacterium hominis]